MRKNLLLLLFFIFYSQLSAQNPFVTGQVLDSTDKSPLIGANVLVSSPTDTAFFGSTTDRNGNFHVNLVRPGQYKIKVSFVGYSSYSNDITVRRRGTELGTILLKASSVNLNEIEIVGKTPPVIQKEDTSEFNADAFKTREGATAEDLVAKMPGMVVENGTVKTQGEEVKRILVDGRQFFSDDPSAVLRNLPSDIVERIQVYDQQSEQAQFTGFDDGNTQKTLNVVTRNRIRSGTFGGLSLGYGNEEKYKTSGNINFFKDNQRISIVGQLNNTNDQNFSSEDLLGIMSSSGGGGRRGGGGGMMGGGQWGQNSNFLVPTKSGLTKTYALGLNYSYQEEKEIELTSSYFFNKTNNNVESSVFREYFTSTLKGQSYNENSFSESNNTNHRFNMRLEYTIDSMKSIIFRPRVSAQINNGSSNLAGITSNTSGFVNSLNSLSSSDLTGINSNAELVYRHRFETPGRTFSLGLEGGYSNNTGEAFLNSKTISQNSAFSDTVDQFTDTDRMGYSASSSLNYTEPVHEDAQLQLSSSFSYSLNENDRKRFADYHLVSNKLDSSLSNVYNREYLTQNYGLGYQYRTELFRFESNFRFRIANLNNKQEFPFNNDLSKQFTSFLPSLSFSYSPSRDINLRLRYRADNNPPSVDKLQNVLDNSDPLRLSIGNPDLKQDYNHNLFLRFSLTDFESMNSFFIMVGGSYIDNYVGNSTIFSDKDTILPEGILLPKGGQFSKPQNLDGYYNFRTFFTYSFPFAFIKSNINLNIFYSQSRTPSVIDAIKNYVRSSNYGSGLVIASNFSPDIDFTISTNSTFNNSENEIKSNLNTKYFSQFTSVKFYWMFWSGFGIMTEVSHQYNDGLASSYDKSYVLLNASLSKKLFANNAGEIRFTAFDIMNNNQNIRRNITEAYYEDIGSNVIKGYYMLSFIYNLRMFGN